MRIRDHLRSHAIAYVALFFALTGSAVALDGHNTVFSDDIVNGEVHAADIGTDAVRSDEIATNAVAAAEVAPNSLRSNDIRNGALTGVDIADGGLTGADIDENSINQVASGATGGCTADGGAETVCADTAITLGEPGKVVVNATGMWRTFAFDASGPDDADVVIGICRLTADGAQIGAIQQMGERRVAAGASPAHVFPADGTMALTGVSSQLGAGSHTVEVLCTEADGDLDWNTINLSVMGTVG